MEYDDLLEILGRSGRYGKVIIFLMAGAGVFNAFTNIGIVFVAGIPEHWCNVPSLNLFNLSQQDIRSISIPLKEGGDSYDSCSMYDRNYSSWTEADVAAALNESSPVDRLPIIKCLDGWHYDQSVYTSTIVSQWDLVCRYKWLRATSLSVFAIGSMIGGVILGSLSDAIGRKPVFCACILLRALSALLSAFSPNYTVFLILRVFIALFQIGTYTIGFVAMMEIVKPSWRVHAGTASFYTWVVSYMATAGVGYLIRDWSTFIWTTSLPPFVLIVYICIIPESPRWLYTKNKHQKADRIVRKMARFDKVDLPEKIEIVVKDKERKGYVWDTVRMPRLRLRSLILFLTWCVTSMVYYGLSYNTSNLGGDVYLNAFIAGAVEAPGYLVPHFTMSYFGRRVTLCGAMLLGGLSLIAILIVPEGMTWLVITLATIGKGGITASFLAVYVITAEIYPTVIRNVGVGTGSFFARVGSFVAPYISELGTTNRVIPPLIFGAAAIATGLIALLLPETKGKKLPETLQDAEEFESSITDAICCNRFRRSAGKNVDVECEMSKSPDSSATLNPAIRTGASNESDESEGEDGQDNANHLVKNVDTLTC